jgi:soluble lytic murein transglycosylase-like protein
VLAGLLLAVAAVVGVLVRDGDTPADVPVVPTAPGEAGADAAPVPDPFAWEPERAAEFERRAAAGNSHLLYTLSPGGAIASAERTARWRPQVERAAAEAGVDPDTLEGLVFLESAGRDDARAPGGLESAVGLTQILAETAQNLLGMRVDLAASRRNTRRLERAERRGQERRAAALRRARRRVDERFDPARALAGTARYLALARERFGREDLAFVSYHMGIGNLESVLRDYTGRADGAIGDVIADEELSYTRVYFDSTPTTTHARAYRRLTALGDDSSNYLWKVAAARDIMRLWRTDRPELERLTALQTAKASAEEVLHPPGETPAFATPDDLRDAWGAGDVVPFPDAPDATGLRRDRRMGELADRVGQEPDLYRGLRPEALAMALYIGAQVRAISGQAPLVVTSTVRDAAYQDELAGRNGEATRNYSLHTTGWAFDVLREYRSRRQALAFQFVLDRLRTLNAIAWVREPAAIHITAAAGVEPLLPLLDRVEG